MNGNNLRNLRKTIGKTQSQMAKIFNISQPTYAAYEKSTREPQNDTLVLMAKYFNVTTDYLLGNSNIEPETEEVVFMPIIAKITAGFGRNTEIEYNGDKLPIPKYMVKGDLEDYFILQVQGDSMYPNYLDGDNVLMQKADCADSGQIVAVSIDGEEATLKKIEYTTESVKLIPLNPNYAPRTFKGKSMNSIRVVGISKYLIRRT